MELEANNNEWKTVEKKKRSNKQPLTEAQKKASQANAARYAIKRAENAKRSRFMAHVTEQLRLEATSMSQLNEKDRLAMIEAKRQADLKEEARKRQAREAFERRRLQKIEEDPTKGPLIKSTIPLNQKVYLYGRHHNCPHGIKPNKVIQMATTSIVCACETSKVTPNKTGVVADFKCKACGGERATSYYNQCGCFFNVCARCKRSTFEYGEHKQWFDKHINPYGTIIVAERVSTDFKAWWEARREKDSRRALTRDYFLSSLRDMTGPPISYADKVRITKPQGGAVSAIASPLKGASDAISAKTKELFDKLRKMLKTTRTKILSNVIFKECRSMLSKMFGMFKYVLGKIYDFILAIGPLNIYHIWKSRESWTSAAVHLSSAYLTWINAKKFSYYAFVEHVRALPENIEASNVLQTLKDSDANYLGVMHTDILHMLKKWTRKNDKNNREWMIETVRAMSRTHDGPASFVDFLTESPIRITNPQSGFADLMSGLFTSLPKYFSAFIEPMNSMFKTYLPLLAGIRHLDGIRVIITKMVTSLIDWVYGKTLTNKQWLEKEICTEGSPINAYVVNYLEYNTNVLIGAVDGKKFNATTARTDYYALLAAAQNYVHEQKRFGNDWVTLFKGIEASFNQPPRAQPRSSEPTMLVLSGPPGVGKSTIWRFIVSKYFEDKYGKSENILERIEDATHTWNSACEFQPGMSSKKIILYDDFAQDRANVSEVLSVINLCTTAPFPINTPAITGVEIKGMHAEPDVLVLCSNVTPQQAAQGLADSNALIRRMDLELEVKKQYDPDKPDEKIIKVLRCSQYVGLINAMLTLQEARTVFTIIEEKKRSALKIVNEKFLKAIKRDLLTVVEPSTIGDIEAKKNLWQKDESFLNDLNTYVANKCINTPQTAKDNIYLVDSPFHSGLNQPPSSFIDDSEGEGLSVTTRAQSGTTILRQMITSLLSGVAITGPTLTVLGVVRAVNSLVNMGLTVAHGEMSYSRLKNELISFFVFGCTVVTGCLTTWAVMKMFVTPTMPQSGTSKTAKRSREAVTVAEASAPAVDLDHIFRKMSGSIRRPDDDVMLNCLFVGGRSVLIPKHFFLTVDGKFIPDGTPIEIIKSNWNGVYKSFDFEMKRIVLLTGNIDKAIAMHKDVASVCFREDLVIYNLDETMFSAEKRMTHHFWDGDYKITNFRVTKLDFIPWHPNGAYCGQFIMSSGSVVKSNIRTARYEGTSETQWQILAEATYEARDASCGSVVRLDRSDAPIVGVHMAAKPGTSFFHFVTRKSLEKAMGSSIDVELPLVVTEPQGSIVNILPERSSLYYEGTVQYPVFSPTKTDLQPSLLYECDGPVKTGPSPLSSSDERMLPEFRNYTAFYKQLFAGYQTYNGKFEAEDLEEAHLSMKDDMRSLNNSSRIELRTLTMGETLNGIDVDANTRIDMKTSCGWPYTQQNLRKEALISEVNGVYTPSNRLGHDYMAAEHQLQHGVVPFLPFTLTIKDERIKLPKIATPRSRLFACANIVHYMISRKYFYTRLMQFYHARKGETFCMPSLDRLSLDWNQLAGHMLEVGEHGFDFDFSFWDRSMQHSMMYYGVQILLEGLELQDLEREAICELLATPASIFQQHCFRSNGIMMSGMLLTFILNCVINELIHRAAWQALMKINLPAMVEMRHYRAYTRAVRAGDDTIMTVTEQLLPFYNGVLVAEYFISKGMQVTSADKNSEILPYKRFMDLLFLKNKTGYERGFYIPLCDLESLKESTYWVRLNRYNNDIVKATQDNTICAMRGMFFHGKEILEAFRTKALTHAPSLQLPSYRELCIIWNTYYKFPGAHADYASRELQVSPLTSALYAQKELRAKQVSEDDQNNMERQYNTNERITKAQAGPMDKMKIETEDVKSAPVTADMGSVDTSRIENSTEGDISKSEVKRVGATIQDGGDLNAMTIATGTTRIESRNLRAEAFLNDTNWDLKKLEHKFTYIGSIDWSLTDDPTTILKSYRLPQDIIVTPAQKVAFDVTRLWKCKQIRMKIVIKASPFYAGSLGFGFTPFGGNPNAYRMINMGAMIQKVSQNEGYEFVIPYRFRAGFLDVTDNQILGQFSIFVISRLATGTGNPNSIQIAVYAAIEDSEFKLPEPVSSTRYYSHKFDRVRVTKAQSGPIENKVKTLLDINTMVCDMETTKMCAGAGTLGSNEIEHFQDMPNDFVQLCKRWTRASNVIVNTTVGKTSILKYNVDQLMERATYALGDVFNLWRGSINVRVVLKSLSGRATARTTFSKDGRTSVIESISGYSYHNEDQIGQVTVPWIFPYFTDFSIATGFADISHGQVQVYLNTIVAEPVTVTVYVSVGDDFHMGVYAGCPAGPKIMKWFPFVPEYEELTTEIDATFPTAYTENNWELEEPAEVSKFNSPMSTSMHQFFDRVRVTRAQSGIVEFIDRALETTLPLVEKVSKLGALLDAHMITEQPHPIQMRQIPYSIAADLPQYIERLRTMNHNGLSLPDEHCFGTTEKETDIHKLLTTTKSWIGNTSWSGSDQAGSELFTLYNGPDIAYTLPGQLHDIVPHLYEFWTGSTIYIFDVIATEMHRGQLLFVFNTYPEDVAFADATQTYFATYDLAEGRGTIAIELPYMSASPYKDVAAGARGDINSTGLLKCFVLNPLRSTTTVSPDVDIVAYKSYGKDFRLGVYGNANYAD